MSLRRLVLAAAATLLVLPAPAWAGVATDEMVSCAALGPKHPGSEANETEADHILARFREAGLQTTAEPFHMPVWEPKGTTLSVASGPGAGTAITAQSFAYSAPSKLDGVELVDLGAGGESDYDGKDVKGKLVLIDAGQTHRTVLIERVMAHGAAGMVYASGSPKDLIQTGALRWGQKPPATVPGITIGADDGTKLHDLLDQGPVKVDAEVKGDRVDVVTRNLIGIKRGTTYPDKYIVVAGHYDSWYAGANDNCSAVGTLLATVAANKDEAPAYTMIYIGWGAEEPGLVGSYTWIRRHQDLIPDTVLNVNLEETASATFNGADPTALPSVVLSAGSTNPALAALVTAAAGTNTVAPPVVGPFTAARQLSGGIIATDVEGFYGQGLQAVTTASSSPYYHTTEDTSDKINLSDLEHVTGYITQLTRTAQATPPEALQTREVPKVVVSAPATAAAGAAVPVKVTVTDVTGQPVSDDKIIMLADQRDNWAVTESYATPVGNGTYTWTLPAGMTDAGLTDIRATDQATAYFADGFAKVDMRAGGLLAGGETCRSRRVVTLSVPRRSGTRRVTRLRVRASAGTVRVRRSGRRYTVRLDLRGAPKGAVTVRLSARTPRGSVEQTRHYLTCA